MLRSSVPRLCGQASYAPSVDAYRRIMRTACIPWIGVRNFLVFAKSTQHRIDWSMICILCNMYIYWSTMITPPYLIAGDCCIKDLSGIKLQLLLFYDIRHFCSRYSFQQSWLRYTRTEQLLLLKMVKRSLLTQCRICVVQTVDYRQSSRSIRTNIQQ